MPSITATSAADLNERLRELYVERALAGLEGLADHQSYMDDLDGEIAASHAAYVGAAVTEIATLRGQLYGRLEG